MADDPRIKMLEPFVWGGRMTPGYGDSWLFYVGRDDVHGVLKTILTDETMALKLSMFGYDDEELNDVIVKKLQDEMVKVQITLDKSQAGGVHERKILEANATLAGERWFNSVAIGQSETHQIVHTKGGVLVSQGLWFEGSTNWSASGEGTGRHPDGTHEAGYKAQENTLLVSANPVHLIRFATRLDASHMVAQKQQAAKGK
jgi:hypothetical protein